MISVGGTMYIPCSSLTAHRTTSTFLKLKIMDEKFETVWQALVDHGTSKRNHDAAERFWNTLTPKQKDQVYRNIPQKVKEGKFVQYDPIRAIKENSRMHQLPEPENLNQSGKYDTLVKQVPLVSAAYKGFFGIYTLADALEYGMDIRYGMNFDYEAYKAGNG